MRLSMEEARIALNEISSTIVELATENQERATYVDEVYQKAIQMQEEVKTINGIVSKIKGLSDGLHMLGINTAIEAANAQMPTVGVVATEMDRMSTEYQSLNKEVQKLAKDLEAKATWLATSLAHSVQSVSTTSAALEQISATVEQLVANIESED